MFLLNMNTFKLKLWSKLMIYIHNVYNSSLILYIFIYNSFMLLMIKHQLQIDVKHVLIKNFKFTLFIMMWFIMFYATCNDKSIVKIDWNDEFQFNFVTKYDYMMFDQRHAQAPWSSLLSLFLVIRHLTRPWGLSWTLEARSKLMSRLGEN